MFQQITKARAQAISQRKAPPEITVAAMVRGDDGVAGEIGDRVALAAGHRIETRKKVEQNIAGGILAILKRGTCAEAPPNDPPHQRHGDFEDEAFPGTRIRGMQNFRQTIFGRPVISALRPLPCLL